MSPQDFSNVRRTVRAGNDIYMALLVVSAILLTIALTLCSIEIYSMYYAQPGEAVVTSEQVEPSPAAEQPKAPVQPPEGQGAAQPATKPAGQPGAAANP